MEKKGDVTALSSMFPPDEAYKASVRVKEAITESQTQLEQLEGFIDDNISLINLVQKLPDETHHDIMVPFGKAAFFPGRLIHTNEFMVLLGEGYYAERTCKQTVEILKRRGNALETQVESVKAVIKDLKAEASFFDATVFESAEGLVEIREEYIEEGSSGTLDSAEKIAGSDFTRPPNVSDGNTAAEDDEYAHIFSRMEELEKEEEAEMANESMAKDQIQAEIETQNITNQEAIHTPKDKATEMQELSTGISKMMDKALEAPKEKQKVQAPLMSSDTAFTGSIIEHRTRSIERNSQEHQRGDDDALRSSRPVSRFKLQKQQRK